MSGADRKVKKGMRFIQRTREKKMEEWQDGYSRFLEVIGFETSDYFGRRARCAVHYKSTESDNSYPGKETLVSTARLGDPTKFTVIHEK